MAGAPGSMYRGLVPAPANLVPCRTTAIVPGTPTSGKSLRLLVPAPSRPCPTHMFSKGTLFGLTTLFMAFTRVESVEGAVLGYISRHVGQDNASLLA